MVAFLEPIVVFLVRTVLPFVWTKIIKRVLVWLWEWNVVKPLKWLWGAVVGLWKIVAVFFIFVFSGLKQFLSVFFGMSIKTRLLLLFATIWKFLSAFKVFFIFGLLGGLYKILELFGVNLFAKILEFLLWIAKEILSVFLPVIFGAIDINSMLTSVNSYYKALPPCFVEIMLACGLSEAINSIISTCVLCITIRFAFFIMRR